MSASSSLTPDDHFASQRRSMVERQLVARGIVDPRVLAAMASVPREQFVPVADREMSYYDGALPIGSEQTISQPFTVAFMCEAAQLKGPEHVLEIGAGCGYGAAVLAQLAASVATVERLGDLARQAEANLARCGYRNVEVHVGDGTLGWPATAPYDAIVVTAGAVGLPEAYVQQLAEGGRIIIPIGADRGSQVMYRLTRRGDRLESEQLGGFAFVPLIGAGVLRPNCGEQSLSQPGT
jgi:protein-L-isoaspartate(D-aspartate) O-methyltransferase